MRRFRFYRLRDSQTPKRNTVIFRCRHYMSAPILRPPLPPPLTHEGIRFVLDQSVASEPLPNEILIAIATSLQSLLPVGDLRSNERGELCAVQGASEPVPSLWYQSGLLIGVDRNPL